MASWSRAYGFCGHMSFDLPTASLMGSSGGNSIGSSNACFSLFTFSADVTANGLLGLATLCGDCGFGEGEICGVMYSGCCGGVEAGLGVCCDKKSLAGVYFGGGLHCCGCWMPVGNNRRNKETTILC